MDKLNDKLKQEIEGFRAQGRRFLKKELTVAEFKGISGGMGVYAQRGGEAFMIRLRTPSGIVTLPHLKLICSFAERYELDRVHLTTRQAIQLHDLGIDAVCDVMAESIDHGLYTRGGGGNFPRNVALSPLSGVEKGEAFDVTPYALQVGDYLLENMLTYRLPRKLKIAFSNNDADTANSTINDLGFIAVVEDGKPRFSMCLAGGLGGNPAKSIPYGKTVAPEEVLYYVQAMIELFAAEGDYENKAKARTRYIPVRMGEQEFFACYEKHLADVRGRLHFDGIAAQIVPEDAGTHALEASRCLIPQKQDGLYTVLLHPANGQLPVGQMRLLAAFLGDCTGAEIRLSMTESMYVRNLTEARALALIAQMDGLCHTEQVRQSVSCIGVPRCQSGMEKSQQLLSDIMTALETENVPLAWLPQLYISGCGNSCSRHQAAELGLAGRKKRVNDVSADVFEVFVGGVVGRGCTVLGESAGMILAERVPAFICALGNVLAREQLSLAAFRLRDPEGFSGLISSYLV